MEWGQSPWGFGRRWLISTQKICLALVSWFQSWHSSHSKKKGKRAASISCSKCHNMPQAIAIISVRKGRKGISWRAWGGTSPWLGTMLYPCALHSYSNYPIPHLLSESVKPSIKSTHIATATHKINYLHKPLISWNGLWWSSYFSFPFHNKFKKGKEGRTSW